MGRLFPSWLRKFFRDDQHWENLNFFRSITIFRGMTARQLGRIMQAMQERIYRQGETLFSEGEIGRAVFIIKSGQVELTKKTAHGQNRRLGILGPGQIFGEMALLENRPRSATANVIEEGTIHLLYASTMESLIRRYPDAGVRLMRNMAMMLSSLLRRTNEKMEEKDQQRGLKAS